MVSVQLKVGVGNCILWSCPNHRPGVEICNSLCVSYRSVAGDPHTDVAAILTLAGCAHLAPRKGSCLTSPVSFWVETGKDPKTLPRHNGLFPFSRVGIAVSI